MVGLRRYLFLALLGGSLCAQVTTSTDSATVFIYRLRVFVASKRRMTLSLDGEPLAYLQNGRYFAVKLTPGKHVLADKKPGDNIDFTVQAGQIYYVRAEIAESGVLGFNVPTPGLSSVYPIQQPIAARPSQIQSRSPASSSA